LPDPVVSHFRLSFSLPAFLCPCLSPVAGPRLPQAQKRRTLNHIFRGVLQKPERRTAPPVCRRLAGRPVPRKQKGRAPPERRDAALRLQNQKEISTDRQTDRQTDAYPVPMHGAGINGLKNPVPPVMRSSFSKQYEFRTRGQSLSTGFP